MHYRHLNKLRDIKRAKPVTECRGGFLNYWQTIKPVSVTSLGLRTAGTQSDSS